MNGLWSYPTFKLTSLPGTGLQMMAEDTRFLVREKWYSEDHESPDRTIFPCFPHFPKPPRPMAETQVCLDTCITSSRFASKLRKANLRNPYSFIMSCNQICPSFTQREKLYLLCCTANTVDPLLQWETLSQFFKCKYSLKQKSVSISAFSCAKKVKVWWRILFQHCLPSGRPQFYVPSRNSITNSWYF